MKTVLILMLAVFGSGCGAPMQMGQVQKQQARSCHLQLTYNCPEPVVGQPYFCAPTVSEECATPVAGEGGQAEFAGTRAESK